MSFRHNDNFSHMTTLKWLVMADHGHAWWYNGAPFKKVWEPCKNWTLGQASPLFPSPLPPLPPLPQSTISVPPAERHRVSVRGVPHRGRLLSVCRPAAHHPGQHGARVGL